MSDIAISVQNLSKRYRIGKSEAQTTKRRSITRRIASPFQYLYSTLRQPAPDEVIWALRDVSFEVKRGEVLGIIGRNGAGKTTLLKILSRITEPTSGRAILNGRVGSLLEVGTGFHPELTGRENIYLSGAILGMKKAEIDRKLDEIVDFSGVEKFIDTPVKRYSSGMRVRLAFSVAAHLEPEILLIDEVLAVGDAEFQKKCLGKMGDVAQEGRTVIFVSHNMGAIRTLCQRCIWLSEGDIHLDSMSEYIVEQYLMQLSEMSTFGAEISWNLENAPGSDEFQLKKIQLLSKNGTAKTTFLNDESFYIHLYYNILKDLSGMRLVLQILKSTGEIAFTSTDHSIRGFKVTNSGKYKSTCHIPGGLMNLGQYIIKINAGIPGVRSLLNPIELMRFSIIGTGNQGSIYQDDRNWPGVVCPKLEWIINSKEV